MTDTTHQSDRPSKVIPDGQTTRRRFLGFAPIATVAALTGRVSGLPHGGDPHRGFAISIGDESTQPNPSDQRRLLHITDDDGQVSYTTEEVANWTGIGSLSGASASANNGEPHKGFAVYVGGAAQRPTPPERHRILYIAEDTGQISYTLWDDPTWTDIGALSTGGGGGAVSWNWDDELAAEGMGHYSQVNTDYGDASILQQAYDYQNFSEISPDPVACYPLHEDSGSTANDVAGSNNGTINGATVGQTGILGTTAYSFDGDDRIDISNHGSTLTSFTLAAWVNCDNESDNPARIFSARTSNNFYSLNQIGDSFDVLIRDSDGNFPRATGGNITPGTWQFIVGTWDGSTIELYVDATSVDTASTASMGSAANAQGTAIGGRANDSEYISADIAGLSLYDVALTQSQVQTLYDVVNTAGRWTSTKKTL